VNKKSAKMAELKKNEPVVDRLYKDAADRIEKNMNQYSDSVHG
jgi:hypothetical protein